jgi:hypothetical protein
VVECIVDFNRDIVTEKDIILDKKMTAERKVNELQKIKFDKSTKKDYHY